MLGPLFNRELQTVPRRERHHLVRAAALLFLWVLGITAWQAAVGFQRDASLGEIARFGPLLFQIAALMELTLLMFFSVVSASSTVSQEKDRKTFLLLLMTDLKDYEIVLGKMLGSLLPIVTLFTVTIPFYMFLLLLGGIGLQQILQAMVIMFATAIAAGSLGALIALWRDKTYQSLALSVLALMLYLMLVQGVRLLGNLAFPSPAWAQFAGYFDPFTALIRVLKATDQSVVPSAWIFLAVMSGITIFLNSFGILKLRKWNPSGETIKRSEIEDSEEMDAEQRAKAHAAPGKIREVWENPILWREMKTLAYGRKPLLIKLAYGIVLALICYYGFGQLQSNFDRPDYVAAYGLVPITVLTMLLVAAQAVTSITSERDGKCLDLLLVTDLKPKEFIFGKLLGVLYNTKEFIIPPLLVALYYGYRGTLAYTAPDESVLMKNFAPTLALVGTIAILISFVLTLGLHVALRTENSRLAVVNTLGTVFFISIGTLISIYLIVINGGSLGNQLLSFSAFLGLGIGGLWFVFSGDRPAPALTIAAFLCPLAVFYSVLNILIGKPGSLESSDPLVPAMVIASAFGFTMSAFLVPLLTEFDVALGRTTANE